ncbi:MAG: hypothetical protein F7C37_04770 [Desulfurococcales archaeon]|nr:hypothetical protein [Desulfurococcales archaeon]
MERSLRRRLIRDINDLGYKSHSWQFIKRKIADPVIECLTSILRECGVNCVKSIYLADLTGAEHSYIQGHGGKDLDIIVFAPGCEALNKDVERLIESSLDEAARIVINEVLGFDPVEKLGIPNVIEIHIVRSEEDTPYWNLIFSRFSRLIKVWDSEETRGG